MTTLHRQFIVDSCSAKVFERGKKLLNTVEIIEQTDTKVRAKVAGTKVYTTSLKHITGQTWQGDCNCPAFADWEGWCKHIVGLALLVSGETPAKGSKQQLTVSPYQAIQEYLNTQDVATLRTMILERAEQDTSWFRMLKTRAATALAMQAVTDAKQGKSANIKELQKGLRKSMRQALRTRRFIEYYDTIAFADNAQQFLQELPALIKTHPLMVKELLDDAFDDLEHTLENSEDDGAIQGLFDDVLTLHRDAAAAAINAGDLDPAQLGKELYLLESQDEYGLTSDLLTHYGDMLGETGRDAYEKAVDHAWQQLPALGADAEHQAGHHYNSRRNTIQRMREAVAEDRASRDGNMAELIEVYSKDLSSSYRYYELATLCVTHQRDDLAQRYVIQGLENFAGYDDRLLDLIGEIAAREEDPALAFSWYKRVFNEEPTAKNFKRLRDVATTLNRWDQLQKECLKTIEKAITAPKKPAKPVPDFKIIDLGGGRHGYAFPSVNLFDLRRDGTTLVEVLLLEDDIQSAWDMANKHGCSEVLWEKLTDKHAKTHPAEVVPKYQAWIHQHIQRTDKKAYQEALKLLKKLKPLMVKTESAEAFATFVQDLRTQYKAKRNMMKLLADM